MKIPILTLDQFQFGATPSSPFMYHLSCTLCSGEILWIQGPNGSGKSTLLKTILGQGYHIGGTLHVPPLKEIGYLPQLQNKTVPWPITLNEVLELSTTSSDRSLLKTVNKKALWNTSSGGERQRTLLQRVIGTQPQLLLLDEPLNHLDISSRRAVITLIEKYLLTGGSVVIVAHDDIPKNLAPYLAQSITLSEEESDV